MMPAQVMSATVAVLTDALPQLLDFVNKLFTRHLF
jgi:hypothetical protein